MSRVIRVLFDFNSPCETYYPKEWYEYVEKLGSTVLDLDLTTIHYKEDSYRYSKIGRIPTMKFVEEFKSKGMII
jgi:hypothetical protein